MVLERWSPSTGRDSWRRALETEHLLLWELCENLEVGSPLLGTLKDM